MRIGCVNGCKDVRKVMTEIALSTLFEANVVGMDIMFYEGLAHDHLRRVQLERNYSCLHDANASYIC